MAESRQREEELLISVLLVLATLVFAEVVKVVL